MELLFDYIDEILNEDELSRLKEKSELSRVIDAELGASTHSSLVYIS